MRPSTSNMEHLDKKKCPRCGNVGDFEVFEEIEIEKRPARQQVPLPGYEEKREPYDEFTFLSIGALRFRAMAVSYYIPTENDMILISIGGSSFKLPVPEETTAREYARDLDKILKLDGYADD
jgi:hypothetical protein